MRTRLLALLVLSIIIVIPGLIYWYFFRHQVATLIFSIPGEKFSIELAGTLNSKYLPLADKFLNFYRECDSVCEFAPIAPTQYAITMTSTGYSRILDNVILNTGETKYISYQLQSEVAIVPYNISTTGSQELGKTLVTQAEIQDKNNQYILIGVDQNNRVYAERANLVIREVGILSLTGFELLFPIPDGAGSFSMDITGQHIIAPIFGDKTLIYTLDTQKLREIKVSNIIGYTPSGVEDKILTQSGISLGGTDDLGMNTRFTDWLDISDRVRIGYISADDTKKLQLSDMSLGQSVLILLDRYTGQSSIIQQGLEIRFLLFHNQIPVFLDQKNQAWEIQIPG